MKAVMLSIQPQWCEKILSGEKTVEVRKTRPKLKTPFKCYIYQTGGRWIYKILPWLAERQKKAVAEFICDQIYTGNPCYEYGEYGDEWSYDVPEEVMNNTCLSSGDILDYAYNPKEDDFQKLYFWNISDLKIYDKPKKISDFQMKRPPQSWCYVEEGGGRNFD